ncbi:MAG: transporter [Acidobacteria bacterium]|nr:MAG: transporter [Acidobacteriota bacterium]
MKSLGHHVWTLLLVGVLALGTACSKVSGDSEVTSEVQSKLSADSGLQGKQLTVQTSGGVVTLSGTVDNDTQRNAASHYASMVPGVEQVVNNLQVGSAPSMAMTSQAAQESEQTPAEPESAPVKPRPSVPRERSRPIRRSAPRESSMADSRPEPAIAPPQNSDPAPAQQTPVPAAAPAPPPAPKRVTIPSGTTLAIRLVDELDSETAQAGQTFKATLDAPVSADGDVVIPAGHDVQGHVIDVKSAGKFAGKSLLALQLDRISVGTSSYNIQTDEYRREGSSRGKSTATKVGAGAAIGAIIGGIAGGGKGAAIGAAAGGGVGGGVQAATKSQQIKLATESVLSFTLQSSVTVTATSEGPNPGRHKLETPQ